MPQDPGACNHTLGVRVSDDGGFLFASEWSIRVRYLRERYAEWKQNPNATPRVIAVKDQYSDYQFIDDEYCLFDFCPDCGANLGAWRNKGADK